MASLQDIEADCNRLLETGLFARVRPKTQLPMGTQAPSYLRDRDGHLNPVIPLNQVCPSAITCPSSMLSTLSCLSEGASFHWSGGDSLSLCLVGTAFQCHCFTRKM